MFSPTSLEEALNLLGNLLDDRRLTFEVVAIGGGGLQLIGVIDRPTKDVDLVALRDGDLLLPIEDGLPPALNDAIIDVARTMGLPPNWMNSGPSSLLRLGLPAGFIERVERRGYGGLGVSLASRLDQIHFKLYAAADDRPGGKHHVDLQHLGPSARELGLAATWVRTHDPSPGFALMLAGVLRSFGVELEP